MTKTASIGFYILLVGTISQIAAHAISGTDQIATPGKPIVAEKHWPAGVLDLVNDPLRANGWHAWFSEWPNDVNYYELKGQKTEDVNHLIQKLAAIKGSEVQILLNPAKEAGQLAFTTSVEKGSSIPAVFSIGNQEQINQWFEHLEKDSSGIRVFGVYRLEKPPVALPPTLTLYVGHPAVDLGKLKIPDGVQVIADVPKWFRDEHKEETTVKMIDDFVLKRSKSKTPPAVQTPSHNFYNFLTNR